MDRSWVHMDRLTDAYGMGVESFLEFARDNVEFNGVLRCPCQRCGNLSELSIAQVRDHLFFNGFDLTYTRWIWHGEATSSMAATDECNNADRGGHEDFDNIEKLRTDVEVHGVEDPQDFQDIMDEAELPLYEGCQKFSKLSAVLRLFNLKASHGWSNKSFSDLLQLIHEMLPDGNLLPTSYNSANKILSSVGCKYEKIHACPNDCMIYYNGYSEADRCPKCGTSRWKQHRGGRILKKKIPAKVFWYLPIIPRFKRLFVNSEHSRLLTWHKDGNERMHDSKLRHPADAPQWKSFDDTYPDFCADARNLRLGFCTDGINPFSNQSSQHSCWPVMLVIYNLPPWLTMKRRFIQLCMLISGPKQPGSNIDTYLRPLIDDLNTLWSVGVEAYDGYRKESFTLRAALLWTVSDYPAYGNIAGAVTKGYFGCAICGDNTNAIRLKHGKKMSFMSHRKWLPLNHPYRKRKKAFNGLQEFDSAPKPHTFNEILRLLESLNSDHPLTQCWKRKCIFYELPYWGSLMVRHNLDVMHIEKNVCESLISTLLNVKGKSKDSLSTRLDLMELGIRNKLAVVERGSRTYLPPACYTMSKQEKIKFCHFVYNLKVPEGYVSNFRSKVNMQELKLKNMKSHDCHVLMQQILPIALRGTLQKDVRCAITKLSYFFNQLCSKVVDPSLLDDLQMHIVDTLCSFEMLFPPSFFDVMVHLCVHLVREVQICGPVFMRWMYPFERFMKTLKSMVRSKSRPEACIVECYLVEEAAEFCSEYVARANVIGLSAAKNECDVGGRGLFGPTMMSVQSEELSMAHLYVLRNMSVTMPYVEKHVASIKQSFPSKAKNEVWIENYHVKSFVQWLQSYVTQAVETGTMVDDTLRWISCLPQARVLSYEGYIINGFRFHTNRRDNMQLNQNSGVTLMAESYHVSSVKDVNPILSNTCFFGVIEEIWELDYMKFRIPVFKCKWFDPTGINVDDMGFTVIDERKIGFKSDPFILATQATQVFYVNDGFNASNKIVLGRNCRFSADGYSSHEGDLELGTFWKLQSPGLVADADVEPNWLGNGEMDLIHESTRPH